LISVLALGWIFATSVRAQKSKAKPVLPYKIVSIKAFLFLNDQGTQSKKNVADPNVFLWNAIIGEGGAGGYTHETLVIVEIAGEKGSLNTNRKLIFTATEKGKIKLQRTSSIHILNDNGRYYLPYLLYDTGCEPLKLSAKIIGQNKPSIMERKINFECGE
jgi:hypothetical protein